MPMPPMTASGARTAGTVRSPGSRSSSRGDPCLLARPRPTSARSSSGEVRVRGQEVRRALVAVVPQAAAGRRAAWSQPARRSCRRHRRRRAGPDRSACRTAAGTPATPGVPAQPGCVAQTRAPSAPQRCWSTGQQLDLGALAARVRRGGGVVAVEVRRGRRPAAVWPYMPARRHQQDARAVALAQRRPQRARSSGPGPSTCTAIASSWPWADSVRSGGITPALCTSTSRRWPVERNVTDEAAYVVQVANVAPVHLDHRRRAAGRDLRPPRPWPWRGHGRPGGRGRPAGRRRAPWPGRARRWRP